MKTCIFLFLSFTTGILHSQTFEVETILYSGENDQRINLVILSDGYQQAELNQFKTDATALTDALFSQSPFKEYASYFNVHLIKVPSSESGADHPGTASDVSEPVHPVETIDNYFNSSFDTFGIHRLLASSNSTPVYQVLANNFPDYDQVLMVVNSPYYGGSGGPFATTSIEASAGEIAIHELGHSFANLADEYYAGDQYAGEFYNMTQETDPNLVKWSNWYGDFEVGIYQHTDFTNSPKPWYRPHQECKMRYLGYPFCSVCSEAIIEKIHSLTSPIDSFMPSNDNEIDQEFPIDFSLTLNKPQPNSLSTTWLLNGENIAVNEDNLSLTRNQLTEESNTLMAVVEDRSVLQRIDNHENIHIYTINWTVINNNLGIKIVNETNEFDIKTYPNPTSDIVTIDWVAKTQANFRIDVTAMNGQLLQTVVPTDSKSIQVDLTSYTSGFYLFNFYTDDNLIGSKKIIKN